MNTNLIPPKTIGALVGFTVGFAILLYFVLPFQGNNILIDYSFPVGNVGIKGPLLGRVAGGIIMTPIFFALAGALIGNMIGNFKSSKKQILELK